VASVGWVGALCVAAALTLLVAATARSRAVATNVGGDFAKATAD